MNIAKDCVVSFDYTLTDAEGQVLDTSQGSAPLSYLHGSNNIIPGLEKALEGKKEGDSFTVTVPAAEAYGERDESLVINVPLDRFQGVDVVEAGMQFQADTAEGPRIVTVTRVANGMATIDANHPLAGVDLTFAVTIRSVRPATEEELAHGHPHEDFDDACGDDCGEDCGPGCGCGGCH
ncbi:peptidylprolyl isomerase [Treponema sp. J25]|uniref:FKBP-type peptidyl-prolyl cis-trans isomerase n=1 Tax=Treponema sp. J25 TaxID=2094121 RepID=UPI00105008C7|nr:peptidylprolyl isomerase [Treponema sp. J25]TCW61886.1 peptidylprolyl isomerase [Treponema sp. J25]